MYTCTHVLMYKQFSRSWWSVLPVSLRPKSLTKENCSSARCPIRFKRWSQPRAAESLAATLASVLIGQLCSTAGNVSANLFWVWCCIVTNRSSVAPTSNRTSRLSDRECLIFSSQLLVRCARCANCWNQSRVRRAHVKLSCKLVRERWQANYFRRVRWRVNRSFVELRPVGIGRKLLWKIEEN